MSKKKKEEKIRQYADAAYYKDGFGLDVAPVSRGSKVSRTLRAHAPGPWGLSTKDVWRVKDGADVYATLYIDRAAGKDEGDRLRMLGAYLSELGLDLVEVIALPAGQAARLEYGIEDAVELGAIVRLKNAIKVDHKKGKTAK